MLSYVIFFFHFQLTEDIAAGRCMVLVQKGARQVCRLGPEYVMLQYHNMEERTVLKLEKMKKKEVAIHILVRVK